jgi:hypothetical protein
VSRLTNLLRETATEAQREAERRRGLQRVYLKSLADTLNASANSSERERQ